MIWRSGEGGQKQDVVEKSWKHFADSLVPHGEALPLWLHSEDQMVLVQEAHTAMVLLPQPQICCSTSPREGTQQQVSYRR